MGIPEAFGVLCPLEVALLVLYCHHSRISVQNVAEEKKGIRFSSKKKEKGEKNYFLPNSDSRKCGLEPERRCKRRGRLTALSAREWHLRHFGELMNIDSASFFFCGLGDLSISVTHLFDTPNSSGSGKAEPEPQWWLPKPDVESIKRAFKGVTLRDVMQLRMPLFLAGECIPEDWVAD